MANIKVSKQNTIIDGSEVVFLSPCDCSEIQGLTVEYPSESGEVVSQNFVFKDAHGYELSNVDNLFTEDVYVKVILNVTDGIAYIQNADTNAYLEKRFEECGNNNTIIKNVTEVGEFKYYPCIPYNMSEYYYGNNMWIGVYGGYQSNIIRVYSSKDGLNWVEEPIITLDIINNYVDLIYGKGLFIQSNQTGIYYSKDGKEWTKTDNDITFGNTMYSMFDGNRFVIVCDSKTYYSDDGITWLQGGKCGGGGVTGNIACGNGVFIISSYYGRHYISNDNALTWETFSGELRGLTFGKDKFFKKDNEDYLYYSEDGKEWTNTETKHYIWGYGDGIFISISEDENAFYYSEDGIKWTRGKVGLDSDVYFNYLSYGGGKFIYLSNYNNECIPYLLYGEEVRKLDEVVIDLEEKVNDGIYIHTSSFNTMSNTKEGGIELLELRGESAQKTYKGLQLLDFNGTPISSDVSHFEFDGIYDELYMNTTAYQSLYPYIQYNVLDIINDYKGNVLRFDYEHISYYSSESYGVCLVLNYSDDTPTYCHYFCKYNEDIEPYTIPTDVSNISEAYLRFLLRDGEESSGSSTLRIVKPILHIGDKKVDYEPFVNRVTSPNFYYPQEIKSIGVYDEEKGKYAIDIHTYDKEKSKNLINCEGLVEKTDNNIRFTPVYNEDILLYILINGTINGNASYDIGVANLEIGKKYFITGYEDHSGIDIIGKDSSNKTIASTGDNYNRFVATEEKLYCRITVGGGGSVYNNAKLYPMVGELEIDDEIYGTYEPYIPYNGHTERIYVNDSLRIEDIIMQQNGILGVQRNEYEKIFNGTEEITKENMTSTGICVSISDEKVCLHFNSSATYSENICNYFEQECYRYIKNSKQNCFSVYSGKIYLYFTNFTTIEEVREWLVEKYELGNPLIVQTKLEIPIFEPFDLESIKALNRLVTFNETTHIEVIGDVQPPKIIAKYGTSELSAQSIKTSNDVKNIQLTLDNLVDGNEVTY